MLLLTRKRGEAIDIVDRASQRVLATVTVVQVLSGGAVVRLGIEAGQDIAVYRDNMRKGRMEVDDEGQGTGE